jgi:hypothetical protein
MVQKQGAMCFESFEVRQLISLVFASRRVLNLLSVLLETGECCLAVQGKETTLLILKRRSGAKNDLPTVSPFSVSYRLSISGGL